MIWNVSSTMNIKTTVAGAAILAITAAVACPAAGQQAEPAKVVWDGDTATSGKSWVSPANDKNFYRSSEDVGVDGSKALHLHGEGGGWIGGGWNWYGWWPSDGGTDATGFDALEFDLKVQTTGGSLGTLNLWLTSSTAPKAKTATVSIADYVDTDLASGEWHTVAIPLADLKQGADDAFDWQKVWELDLGTWSGSSRTFDIYVDNIGFTKNETTAE